MMTILNQGEMMPEASRLDYAMTNIKLNKSFFSINPEFAKDQPIVFQQKRTSMQVIIRNNVDFSTEGTLANFSQTLETRSDTTAPFKLEVEFLAVFVLLRAPHPQIRNTIVQNMFAQAVFPFLREFAADITRRAGFPPLILNASTCLTGGAPLAVRPGETH
jgi:preprotein translocase subunit SecB